MSRQRSHSSKQRIREPFAHIPKRVIESEAYKALPDWAIRVLLALACQYNGGNNGDLSLTTSNHKRLGVRARWHIYAGLKLLDLVGLIVKTRQGGKPPVGCSLYAVTWRSIDPSDKYDRPIDAGVKPSNPWKEWERSDDWTDVVKTVKHTAKGTPMAVRAGVHVRGSEISTTPGDGPAQTPGEGTSIDEIVPSVVVEQGVMVVPQPVGAF